MDLLIRRATATDADQASDLYVRARWSAAAAGSVPAPAHSADEVSGWVKRVVIPSLDCWLAHAPEGEVIGILVLNDDCVDQLYVDPKLTGRGIGSELLELAKRERPRGLWLWTFVSNHGAQRFYERHGFGEVERNDGTGNEERAPAIRYAWK